jgi:hypothetical protein
MTEIEKYVRRGQRGWEPRWLAGAPVHSETGALIYDSAKGGRSCSRAEREPSRDDSHCPNPVLSSHHTQRFPPSRALCEAVRRVAGR